MLKETLVSRFLQSPPPLHEILINEGKYELIWNTKDEHRATRCLTCSTLSEHVYERTNIYSVQVNI